MLNVVKAVEAVRKFSPTTKIKYREKGQEGIYLTKTNTIIISLDWNMAGLLHEITHAVLWIEEKRTGHDGVWADRFTKIVSEYYEDRKDE